jgi:uncharacterized protein (TIGR00369 family)
MAPHYADRHAPLPPERAERWSAYSQWDVDYLPKLLGLTVEEVRADYARMRLPWRLEISQPAGVAHGGAIATLIDSVVVPAIGSGYDERVGFVTVGLTISFLGALVDDDAVAEGWVVQRGRSMVFCAAEVRAAHTDRLVATGTLTFKVLGPA